MRDATTDAGVLARLIPTARRAALRRVRPGAARRRRGGQDVAGTVRGGLGGAAIIGASLATPFLRSRRVRWGAAGDAPDRRYPGDELVPAPRWGWTHAVEVDAPAGDVWPWLAQVGADRGGFYSYAWLENLVGCRVRNADRVHVEWEAVEGGTLVLHPSAPGLRLVSVVPGRHLVAYGAPDDHAVAAGRPWVAASWLMMVEPRGAGRSRLVSRYRCATSPDLRTRMAYGPALIEPIGFAMDRRMLLGIRERAERTTVEGAPA